MSYLFQSCYRRLSCHHQPGTSHHGVFRSFKSGTSSYWRTHKVDQTLRGNRLAQDFFERQLCASYIVRFAAQVVSPLLNQSQLDDSSAVRVSFFIAFCLSCPFTPRPLSIFHSDCAGNPLAPISTGKSQHFHPLALHSSCSWRYFAFFLSWASSHRVSQGTVGFANHR